MRAPRTLRPAAERAPAPHPVVLRPSAGGQPLPAPVQAKMEGALSHDFANVRVHSGEEAGSIGAVAFTRGSHIHFAPGRYNPHSAAGQRLLGHELAHVVQQRAGRVAMPGGPVPINADARLESEADALGARAARGEAATGGRALAGPAQGAPVGHGSMQPMWVTMKDGKVQYDWTKDNKTASRPSPDHVWMDDDEFVQFKNAGKRTGSNKWSHGPTGAKYYSADGATFYHDAAMGNPVLHGLNHLIDRRRADRTQSDIGLYDISDYKTAQKFEVKGDNMEHDHVLAGASKMQRFHKEYNTGFAIPLAGRKYMLGGVSSADDAYQSAPSIEIRGKGHHEGWDHHDFSSTWGSGRQSNYDIANTGGTQYQLQRPDMDAELPEAAFHRDADTMLRESPQRGDKLAQAGAYRKLYKTNIARQVVNPITQGFTYTGNPLTNKGQGGGITYNEAPGKTQGELTDEMLRNHLAARLKAPGGV